jgi:hypothetical protein
MEIVLMADMKDQQKMFTPPWHLILRLLLSGVRVALHSILYLPSGLWLRLTQYVNFATLYFSELDLWQSNLLTLNPQISFSFSLLVRTFKDLSYVSKTAWKIFAEKNNKNHLRSNHYEVCTAVALCFPNILDAIVLENIKSEDKMGRLAL